MSRPKVFWRVEEWSRLAAAAAPLVLVGMEPLEAFRTAQSVVFKNEPSRTRQLDGHSSIMHGLPILNDKVAALRIGGSTGSHTPRPAPQKEVAAPAPAPARTNAAFISPAIPPDMEVFIEAAAEAEAKRVRQMVEKEIAARVREKLSLPPIPATVSGSVTVLPAEAPAHEEPKTEPKLPPRKHNPEMQHGERAAKPKVLIVGCWPQVRAAVSEEFDEVFDLRFFDNNETDLAPMMRHARNAAFVITIEGIHGNVPNAVRKAAPSGRWQSIHGSEKSLKDRLMKLYAEGK